MEEHFQTFDASGNPLDIVARSVVHRLGLWHQAANVFLFFPDGKLLIQRRQFSKDVWPGAWDVSAAEHLKPGETFEAGAIRGLKEELGVVGASLEAFGDVTRCRLDMPESGIRDYEFQQSFRTVYSGPVFPDVREVIETRLVGISELEAEFADRPEAFTPWFRRRAKELNLFAVTRGSFA